ncbi:MAG TPA: PAS domain S-box protein, partial [Thermodesulfobacteriota bacterium]|nr:PAS domain S-box protein [Thermodesulfobacteriota bacterium]
MRITRRLTLGFLIESVVVVLLIWAVGYFAVSASEKALRRAIEDGSVSLSTEVLSKVERTLHHRIEVFEAYTVDPVLQRAVKESNRAFEAMEDTRAYMEGVESEWRSVPTETVTPLMVGMMESDLSIELRGKMDYFNRRHGSTIFGEVFVTNSFGATVAMTGKTTDFIQSDEAWWQEAKAGGAGGGGGAGGAGGASLGEVAYDESAGLYSLDIGIRIDDPEGNFIGVMKVVLNVEEFLGILRESISGSSPIMQKASMITLVDGKERVLYSTGEYEFLQDVSGLYPEHARVGVEKFVLQGGDLFSVRAHSGGDYGLDWTLIVDHEAAVLFAPVRRVSKGIILVSLAVSALVVITGLMITGTVTRPVLKLRDAALRVRSGDLDALMDVDTADEVGELAESFRETAKRLLSTTVSRDFMTNVIEHMTGALVVVSPDGKVILTNRAAAGLLGLKGEELINRHAAEVLPPEMTVVISEILKRGEIRGVERTVTAKDGKKVPLLFSGILMRSDGGRPVATVLA